MTAHSDAVERECHMCGNKCRSWCQVCTLAFEKRRPVAEMSVEERVDELRMWAGPLEIEFANLHKRIEELMGRSVWTHEMAYFDSLVAELRSGAQANIADVINKIPADKLIVVGLASKGNA